MSAPRDVTPQFRDSLKKDISLILGFLKNPIEGMRLRLDWSWKKTVLIHVLLSVSAGHKWIDSPKCLQYRLWTSLLTAYHLCNKPFVSGLLLLLLPGF